MVSLGGGEVAIDTREVRLEGVDLLDDVLDLGFGMIALNSQRAVLQLQAHPGKRLLVGQFSIFDDLDRDLDLFEI